MRRFYTDLEKDNEVEGIFKKLHEWEAPERQWVPKSRAWFVIYGFFFVCIVFIAALLQEYIFIVAVIAFSFLWFVQGSIAPHITTHMITSIGIKAYGELYKWQNIKHFWFSTKGDTVFLNLDIVEDENPHFTRRIPLILAKNDDQKIFDILLQYIDYGDQHEIGFNIFTQLISGRYIDISKYMVVETEEDLHLKKLNDLASK